MDYHSHYDALIKRAKDRILTGYSERHHITPRCLGGNDDESNLVRLTPEEHYVAHQLLIKMYPDHTGLVWAAFKMTWNSNKGRYNNKLYGWIKRRHQKVAQDRVEDKNPSYGASWWFNPETGQSRKLKPADVPEGYIKGRNLTKKTCQICGREHYKNRLSCSDKCRRQGLSDYNIGKDPTRKIDISESTILKIIEKNKQGTSLQTLAEHYSINKWTIYDIVTRYKKRNGV